MNNVKVVCANKMNVKQNKHLVPMYRRVHVALSIISYVNIIARKTMSFAKMDQSVGMIFAERNTISSTEKKENGVHQTDLQIINANQDMSAETGHALNKSRHANCHITMIVPQTLVYAIKVTTVFQIIVISLLFKQMLVELLGRSREEKMVNGVMIHPIGQLFSVQATFVCIGNASHQMYQLAKCAIHIMI